MVVEVKLSKREERGEKREREGGRAGDVGPATKETRTREGLQEHGNTNETSKRMGLKVEQPTPRKPERRWYFGNEKRLERIH